MCLACVGMHVHKASSIWRPIHAGSMKALIRRSDRPSMKEGVPTHVSVKLWYHTKQCSAKQSTSLLRRQHRGNYIQTFRHSNVPEHLLIHRRMSLCMYVCVCVCVRLCACLFLCLLVCLLVCMYVCLFVHMVSV